MDSGRTVVDAASCSIPELNGCHSRFISRTAMNNKHLDYHHKKNIDVASVFLLSLILSGILAAISITYSLQSEQNNLQKVARFYGNHFSQKITASIQSLSLNLSPLYTMLILHDGRTDHFEKVAEHIAQINPEILNINLARNGIVTNVYPYERNKNALGHNLLESEQRRQEARLARDSRRITLAGPFNLIQGGRGLAFRQPVYLPSSENPQQKQFWGFAIITYRFPDVLFKKMDFTLPDLHLLASRGFAWTLWRTAPVTGTPETLLTSKKAVGKDAQRHPVSLPNATWYFDICPVNGWFDTNTIFLYIYFSIPLCLLFSIATMQFSMLLNKRNEIVLQSKMDTLTDLYNKRSFWELLEPVLKQYLERDSAERSSRLFLCVFDLNNFKAINDTYGHMVGDKILIEFSRRLSSVLSHEEFASRFGGDEFVAAVYGSADFSSKLAELKQLLEGSYNVDEHSLPISVSIGVISPEAAMLRDKPQHLTLGEFFLEKVDMAIICAPSPAISTSARKLPSMWRKACLPSLPKKAPP